jgi:hypothetical protein
MNERIKELAQQADDYATEKCRDGFSNYNSAYDNKFAELIVRECLKECQSEMDCREIRKKFGVE